MLQSHLLAKAPFRQYASPVRRIGVALLGLACLACLPAVAAAAAPPAIQYLSPHPLRNHEATLHFTVDPEGLETTYEVEYGFKAGEYFPYHYLWTRELPAGEAPVPGEAKLPAYFEGGLLKGTEYHWRVVAKNAAGTTEGPDETFTTPSGVPPVTTTLPATEETPSSAVMHGTVDPEGTLLTSCRFHVVSEVIVVNKGWSGWDTIENDPFGVLVPCVETPEEIGAGSAPVPVHATVTGLDPEPYFFRLEAANEYENGKEPGAKSINAPLSLLPEVPRLAPPTSGPQPVTAEPAPRRKHHRAKHRRSRLRHNASISAAR